MRRYETIFIINPDLSDEERAPVFTRINDLIPQQGGFLVSQDDWGTRRLAYEIKKKFRGYYVRLDYCGTGAVVNEMERFFRIDDRILKFMTVLLEKGIDVDKIKAELAEAERKTELETQKKPDHKDQSGTAPDGSDLPDHETANDETESSENKKEE